MKKMQNNANLLIAFKKGGIVLFLILQSFYSYAGVEPTLKNTIEDAQFVVNATTTVTDFHYASSTLNAFNLYKVDNRVSLEINQENVAECNSSDFSCEVKLEIKLWDKNGNLNTQTKFLKVDYNLILGQTYQDKSTFIAQGYYKMEVKILSISNPLYSKFLRVSAEMDIERYRDLNPAVPPTIWTTVLNTTDDQIEVTWNSIAGAEEYDLEWVYIDNYDAISGFEPMSGTDYSFENNATRVTIKDNSYKISNVFESGFVLFRIRGVGNNGPDFKHRVEGNWSAPSKGNDIATVFQNNVNALEITFALNHEKNLNWQYQATYAEEGKNKAIITYSDGSFRSRESVTRINSEASTVSAETLYDHQGRPVISTIPAPTQNNKIQSYVGNTPTIDRALFDMDVNYSNAPTLTSAPAADYYSSANPDATSATAPTWSKYIADAEGYAYTQTIYTPDNTGRVKTQSGVGEKFKIGSGHETNYYYGTPFQEELDRLFGNSVGNFDHYQKNMVEDPNGQLSVSYLDLQGRTIATALAGNAPNNLKPLPATVQNMSVNLLNGIQQTTPNGTLKISKTFLVSNASTYTFDYGFEKKCYTDDCIDPICQDCKYDLEITLKDEFGNSKLDGGAAASFTKTDVKGDYNLSTDPAFAGKTSTYLTPGSYTITKTLTVNEATYATYLQQYLSTSTCLKTEQDFINDHTAAIDFSGCDMTCTECETALGTKPDFLNNALQILTDKGEAHTQVAIDAINAKYDEKLANCKAICEDDPCENYLSVIQHDVAQGGQYEGMDVTSHPEYCFYQECLDQKESRLYDQAMLNTESYADALAAGYLNPLNTHPFYQPGTGDPYFVGGPGDLAQMQNNLDQFVLRNGQYASTWELAIYTLMCSNGAALNIQDVKDCADAHQGSIDQCKPTADYMWAMFRAFYLAEKDKLIQANSACNSIVIPTGKTARFNYTTQLNNRLTQNGVTNNTLASTQAAMAASCQSTCESYADGWMDQLEGCNLLPAEKLIIRNALIQVCVDGCDVNNPSGSRTVNPSLSPAPNFTSFKDVLQKALLGSPAGNIYVAGVCDDLLITFPNNYNANALGASNNCPVDPCINDIHSLAVKNAVIANAQASSGACEKCINCEDLYATMGAFNTLHPGAASYPLATYKTMIETHFNSTLGMRLTYFQIIDSIASCDSMNPNLPEFSTNRICNTLEKQAYVSNCSTQLVLQATASAKIAYQNYLDAEIAKYRAAYLAKCMEVRHTEYFTLDFEIKEHHYTLYYYDQANNLVQTVPPLGVKPLNTLQTASVQTARVANTGFTYPIHTHKTRYKFNTLNQLVEQNTPDGGTSHFWYDRLGRLSVSQNAEQKANNKYSYTMFDDLGRMDEVGVNQTTAAMNFSVAFNDASLQTWKTGGSHTEITKTHYDEAPFSISYAGFSQDNLRNRISSVTYQDAAGSIYQSASHYSYDIHGNVNSLVQENTDMATYGQAFKKLDYIYDLISGNVNEVQYQKDQTDQFLHRYEYDADNRIVWAETSQNGIHWDRDAEYDFYKHGPLARVETGGLKVQGTDYAYTLQGWLKGVNSGTSKVNRDIGEDGKSTSNHKYVARDEFGYSLNYYDGDYKSIGTIAANDFFIPSQTGSGYNTASPSLYNGNISGMVTAIRQFMQAGAAPIGKVYAYDQLNRIVSSRTWDNIDLPNNSWQAGGTEMPAYQTDYSFDANGNITSLDRTGNNAANFDMDQLDYHYNPVNNQLNYVDDAIATTNYTEDIDDQDVGNYRYDAIGRLTQDLKEEIADIKWTVSNKIKSIIRTSSSTKPRLDFTYNPMGNRIGKTVTTTAGSTSTYYVLDATGNTMATYQTEGTELKWQSAMIYGSSRVGIMEPAIEEIPAPTSSCDLGKLDLSSDEGEYHQGIEEHLHSIFGIGLHEWVQNQVDGTLGTANQETRDALNEWIRQSIEGFDNARDQERMANIMLKLLCKLQCYGIDDEFNFTIDLNNLFQTHIMNAVNGGMGLKEALDKNWSTLENAVLQDLENQGYTDNCKQETKDCGQMKVYHFSSNTGLPMESYLNNTYGLITQQWKNQSINNSLGGISLTVHQYIENLYTHVMSNYTSSPADEEDLANAWVDWLCRLSCFGLDASFNPDDWEARFNVAIADAMNNNGYTLEKAIKLHWQDFVDGTIQNIEAEGYTDGCASGAAIANFHRGTKKYELSNHLGNVQVVVTDKRTPVCNGMMQTTAYEAEVISAVDYYPFGMVMPDRDYASEEYRYGFQGQESDNEIAEQQGSYINYKYRMHDSRIGRFFATDPLEYIYSWNSPYAFSENKVIHGIELEGLEFVIYHVLLVDGGAIMTKVEDLTNMTLEELQVIHGKAKAKKFYELHSVSYGSLGQGVLYRYYMENENGEKDYKYDRFEFKSGIGRYGKFNGPGCLTVCGNDWLNEDENNQGDSYDFNSKPIDQPDALGKRHDLQYGTIIPYTNFKTVDGYDFDVEYLKNLKQYLIDSDPDLNPEYKDPYTGRPASDDARAFAKRAVLYFEHFMVKPKARKLSKKEQNETPNEEYQYIPNRHGGMPN